ncbi:hypothetical protein [Shewanella sp. NIFS-20-20]|uniref:hypothetical protein n=1 Tax=Shewanella sp. NIFS-20-20 TaxID=2853806 RepID=UPI001C476EC3|nr:hypothetical protein [Shewanella sp. NIFS-20-20]MBV7314338.1 hypothetical protein [Shewanella sp. NIFS-20-20]
MDFSSKNKMHAASFSAQQRLIKSVFAGKTVLCQQCQQPLQLLAPPKHASHNNSDAVYGIRCQRACTDIELDFI